MAITLFGYSFQHKPKLPIPETFTPKDNDDGAVVISAAGAYGTYVDLDGTVRTEAELINRYREMSLHPEIDSAADEIVNEAINTEEQEVVKINLDDLDQPKKVKDAIEQCFNDVIRLLDFRNNAYNIFKRWYIDGRLYFHAIINNEKTDEGIQELRYIDPRKIRKIREVIKKNVRGGESVTNDSVTQDTKNEYYIYNEKGFNTGSGRPVGPATTGLRIAADAIVHAVSGLTDVNGTMVLSYLHKAIKGLNQLRTLEDANVIYCLVADTRILTEFGYKYIKDITIEDKIYVYNKGKLELTKVKNQWLSGFKSVFKIKSKHFSLTGTDTHPILVLDQEGQEKYVNIGDLKIGKHSFVIPHREDKGINIKFPSPKRTVVVTLKNPKIWSELKIEKKEETINELESRYQVGGSRIRNFLYGLQAIDKTKAISILNEFDLVEKAELIEKYEGWAKNQINLSSEFVDEDFARLFGFMIGDGSVSQHALTFAESPDEKQNLYYASLLEKYFNNCRKYKGERKYLNYYTSNTLGAELFQEMEWISGSKHKRVPSWVFQAKNNIKKAFIKGLADADGHITHRGSRWYCEFELCNKELIEDIKELWSSLNYCSGHIRHRVRKAEYRKFGEDMRQMKETESWDIFISDCLLPPSEKIISIKYEGEEDVYDIEVEHEAHNFVANQIVTHNCMTRAPERRVWYIDVGNLPKMKAEQYVRDIMVKHKNRLIYDSASGEIRDDRKFMCYALDTKIPLLDGRTLSLQEIITEYKEGKLNWVYSCDPLTGKFVPGPVSWAGITKTNSEVVRVTFDNGKSVVCTPDHKFPVWGKGLIEAKDLLGQSVIPGYRRMKPVYDGGQPYEQIYKNDTKTWEFTHREVAKWKDDSGIREEMIFNPDYSGKRNTIHHRDYNRLNNSPTNLVRMNRDDHINFHAHFARGKLRPNKSEDFTPEWSKKYHAEELVNHKAISVEWLFEKIDVGCITVDLEETYHSNHTYLLDAGVYTKNTMLEDYWLPRRGDGKGTQVETLPAGQNMGEMENVKYFQRKLYSSLHVPIGRLYQDDMYSMGQDLSAGISREEIKFGKFIGRLRNQFGKLFIDVLKKQIVLKHVMTIEDFERNVVPYLRFDFTKDNFFMEMKDNQVLLQRIDVVHQMMDLVGRYYSNEWIIKNVLHQSDEEMEKMRQEISEEMMDPIYNPPMPTEGGPGGDDQDQGQDGNQDMEPSPEASDQLQRAKQTYDMIGGSKAGSQKMIPDYKKANKIIAKNAG